MRDPATARRALLAGLAVLAAASAAARLAFALIEAGTPAREFDEATVGLGRARTLAAALPGIVSGTGRRAVMMGASTAVLGFSPEEFDARAHRDGIEWTTYNLGLVSATPAILRLLARRLRSLCLGSRSRLSLGLIEFGPSTATEAFQGKPHMFLKMALLMAWPDVLWDARRSPADASRLAALKLFAGLNADHFTELLRQRIFPPDDDPLTSAHAKLLRRLEAAEGPIQPWDAARRGGVRTLIAETAPEYAGYLQLALSPAALKSEVDTFVGASDIMELRFSEDAVADFIDAVKTMQEVCDRTVVVIPARNPSWNRPTVEASARLAAVLARIQKETGAPIMDFSRDASFTAGDFVDLLHLNETTGKPKFARLLADRSIALTRD
jgi:hypothetical protein